jgi:hypothetical protein
MLLREMLKAREEIIFAIFATIFGLGKDSTVEPSDLLAA